MVWIQDCSISVVLFVGGKLLCRSWTISAQPVACVAHLMFCDFPPVWVCGVLWWRIRYYIKDCVWTEWPVWNNRKLYMQVVNLVWLKGTIWEAIRCVTQERSVTSWRYWITVSTCLPIQERHTSNSYHHNRSLRSSVALCGYQIFVCIVEYKEFSELWLLFRPVQCC